MRNPLSEKRKVLVETLRSDENVLYRRGTESKEAGVEQTFLVSVSNKAILPRLPLAMPSQLSRSTSL